MHNPHRLESEVLNKYFRHSKYASFQRQLNYFGFRKLAGKGKMAPCSYINENATNDLRSLLRMKRKTSATTKGGESKGGQNGGGDGKGKKRSVSIGAGSASAAMMSNQNSTSKGGKRSRGSRSKNGDDTGAAAKIAVGKGVRHQLNGYLRNSASTSAAVPCKVGSSSLNERGSTDPSSIAKSVVGKGVAHHFAMQTAPSAVSSQTSSACNLSSSNLDGFRDQGTGNNFTFLDPPQLGMGVDYIENNLSELQNNYQSSLNACSSAGVESGGVQSQSSLEPTGKPLHRDSSLVALAMIPSLSSVDLTAAAQMPAPTAVGQSDNDGSNAENDEKGPGMMTFIDFP